MAGLNQGRRALIDPWHAAIEIRLATRPGRTVVERCRRHGPLYLQRALYPETDGTSHLYLLHPPGGVVQGDDLSTELTAPAGTRSLLTTPASAKLYRAPRAASRQSTRLRVAANAQVEWLPQDTIVFDGARAANHLYLDLAAGARLIAWDMVCLGRPAGGNPFDHGAFDSRIELRVDGALHWIERSRIPGARDAALMSAPWGLDGRPAFGTLIAYGFTSDTAPIVQAVRDSIADHAYAGVTDIDGALVVRVLAGHSQAVRIILEHAWHTLRVALLGKTPVVPRIWLT